MTSRTYVEVEARLRERLESEPAGLRRHVLRVVDEAERLAALHGVDAQRTRLAALAHDLLRACTPARLLEIAGEQRYPADEVERREPVLLHGPLAVAVARAEFGIDDGGVLRAVASHTTARAGMSPLEKVLFVADKIEPEKRERAPAVAHVAALAEHDLDAALLACLDHQLRVAAERGWPLHRNTVAARNALLARGIARPDSATAAQTRGRRSDRPTDSPTD